MRDKTKLFGALALAHAHRLRCKSLPPIQDGEAERLVAGFLAISDITICPARYAAPVEQQLHAERRVY